MIKMKMKPSFFLSTQKGLTLVEVLISSSLLFLIIVSGTMIFTNIQGHLTLAEKEARLQQYARTVMTQMSRELRQASDVFVTRPSDTTGHLVNYTDVFVVVPNVNANTGALVGTYKLVRYFYEEDHQKPGSGINSLYRAWKSNGASKELPSAYSGTTLTSTELFKDNRTRLLREAAALRPGDESYFTYDDQSGLIRIVLMVATYVTRPDSAFQYQVERVFRVETDVKLRS